MLARAIVAQFVVFRLPLLRGLGAADNQHFGDFIRPKTAYAALKILAYGRHRLAFFPCIYHFLTENPLQKLNVNSP